jgi:hypothetical protein
MLLQSKLSSHSRSERMRLSSLLPASRESVPACQPASTAETAASRARVHRRSTSFIALTIAPAVRDAIGVATDRFRGEGADG